jgi:hypothetical protein
MFNKTKIKLNLVADVTGAPSMPSWADIETLSAIIDNIPVETISQAIKESRNPIQYSLVKGAVSYKTKDVVELMDSKIHYAGGLQ